MSFEVAVPVYVQTSDKTGLLVRGIRDQKGWNQCPEWGPGSRVGVPEKGKIKKNQKLFEPFLKMNSTRWVPQDIPKGSKCPE